MDHHVAAPVRVSGMGWLCPFLAWFVACDNAFAFSIIKDVFDLLVDAVESLAAGAFSVDLLELCFEFVVGELGVVDHWGYSSSS
jgi:hypothetical protein